MSLRIRLLGSPRLERDGRIIAGPRGQKAWALLAYLVLSRNHPSRQRLAELFFADADDPLGSLRWNLAELRRVLGEPGAFRGDPVEVALQPGTDVDVRLVLNADVPEAHAIEELGAELLEGITFETPGLDSWLVVERRRIAGAVDALLYSRAQIELGAGRAAVAARLAGRLVMLSPFHDQHQELLVRSLIAAGDRAGARAAVDACDRLFRQELGRGASGRLHALLTSAAPDGERGAIRGPAAARAQLDAGRASIAAGAIGPGLECLRRACAEAERCGDAHLHARALLALGSALAHTMAEHAESGAVLHRAAAIACDIGSHAIAATAHRELGFVDVLAGRRDRAAAWLDRARSEAGGDDEELSSIAGVRGVNLSDAAYYEEALESFDESVERAERCGRRRQVAWSTTFMARVHLLTGRTRPARRALHRALEITEREQWIAFQPLPESLLAHVDLAEGRPDQARDALEHAFTVACQVADPCWEGFACRGLALVEAARGRHHDAIAWLDDARTRCTRVPTPYEWVHAWILDALCGVADAGGTAAWVDPLEALAARTGMREFVVRAYLHRARSGDARALDTARLLAADVANPVLAASVA